MWYNNGAGENHIGVPQHKGGRQAHPESHIGSARMPPTSFWLREIIMAKSSKLPAQPTVEQPAGAAVRDEQPFLRFHHSADLRDKTLAVLSAVEQAPDPTRYRNALSDLVMELTDCGLEYYFVRPLDQAQAGFVSKQSAHAGLAYVKRIMAPVVHNVIGRLDKDQLVTVCAHIRELME